MGFPKTSYRSSAYDAPKSPNGGSKTIFCVFNKIRIPELLTDTLIRHQRVASPAAGITFILALSDASSIAVRITICSRHTTKAIQRTGSDQGQIELGSPWESLSPFA